MHDLAALDKRTSEVSEQISGLLLQALYEQQKAREALGLTPVIENWSSDGRDAYLDAISFVSPPAK